MTRPDREPVERLAAKANELAKLERLCRYIARPGCVCQTRQRQKQQSSKYQSRPNPSRAPCSNDLGAPRVGPFRGRLKRVFDIPQGTLS